MRGGGSFQLGVAQVLVYGLPADAVVTGEEGFRDTVAGARDQFGFPFRCEGLFAPFVGAALLSKGDAFRWRSLMRERSNSGKAPIMESMRLAGVSPPR